MPLAEFTANNTESKILSYSPFFANYSYNPLIGFKPYTSLVSMPPAKLNTNKFVSQIKDLFNYLKKEIAAI